MKIWASLWLSLVLCAPLPARALLDKFIHSDGAISVVAKGSFVDPYFANKALIMAWEAGIDASTPTKRWLLWLVPRQRPDGGFDRFCFQATVWHACRQADADDSSAATFLHLSALYGAADKHKKRMQPKVDAHAETVVGLRMAVQRAQGLLQSLRTQRGTYRALVGQDVEYLMDNTEVYAGLVGAGQLWQARDLKAAIQKHFYTSSAWLPANIAYDRYEFYPSALAPVYRWHTGLVSAAVTEEEAQTWTQRWGTAWLTRKHDEFAWGLVAWSARDTKNQHWIRCWRYRQSLPHNRSRGWTVIDEAADVGLAALGVKPAAKSCTLVLGKK
jgi:hypothetical protein